ncbi:MAG TPA: DegT/DnrJ/EryC1/StrS family aminotransferase [Longimicrobium sp.]|nr:DegT/DnrJ/EryC1/StrS family aminotransferase [Longimicrobium sp.]
MTDLLLHPHPRPGAHRPASADESGAVLAPRATELIAAACAMGRRPVALLPALFCAEVAAAVERAGVRCRVYDVPEDLSHPAECARAALTPEVGAVVAVHPFGLARPWPQVQMGEGVVMVVDACHALRTSHAMAGLIGGGDVVVYSPRKELGWPRGGVATGPRACELGETGPVSAALRRRWRERDLDASAHEGRRVTLAARAALDDLLPPGGPDEVLLALPLLSPRRDEAIRRLRGLGLGAWRWRRPLPGAGPSTTPGAWALRQRLVMVPLPPAPGPALDRILDHVSREPLEPWPCR